MCACTCMCVLACVCVCVCALPGLTYWRLNECDLYHPLPDSLDSGAFLFLQEDTSAVRLSSELVHALIHFNHLNSRRYDVW